LKSSNKKRNKLNLKTNKDNEPKEPAEKKGRAKSKRRCSQTKKISEKKGQIANRDSGPPGALLQWQKKAWKLAL